MLFNIIVFITYWKFGKWFKSKMAILNYPESILLLLSSSSFSSELHLLKAKGVHALWWSIDCWLTLIHTSIITVWQGYFAGGKLHFAGGKLYFAGGKLYFAGGKLYFAGGNHTLRVATYIAGGNRTLRVATVLCGWQPYFAGGNRTLRIETL